MEGNELRGEIPPEFGRLKNLKALTLNENQLSGPLPPELGSLSRLEMLDLDENQLRGSIPSELGKLANLEWLGLWGNKLSGCLPDSLRYVETISGGPSFCTPNQTQRTISTQAEVIVQRANDYVGTDGIQVSHEDMILYCEGLHGLDWDLAIWGSLATDLAEADEPTREEFLRRQKHFNAVLIGLEGVTGRVQDGCAALGVK